MRQTRQAHRDRATDLPPAAGVTRRGRKQRPTEDVGQIGATALAGAQIQAMFAIASAWLDLNAAALNAINVFPVPDGDTGSNMALTLGAAMADLHEDASAEAALATMAHGALMGARGNSGVILSQILRGLAHGAAGAARLDGPALAQAFRVAAETAERAVTNPIEGTILTTLRDVSRGLDAACRPGVRLAELLQAAVEDAKASVARTPELLPVLREAGVVDAGALGLAMILEGCLWYLEGREPPPQVMSITPPPAERLMALEDQHRHLPGFGYCTEFIVDGRNVDVQGLRHGLRLLGDSVLIVGGDTLLRVHVHTEDPGAALSLGVRWGRLFKVKVEDMQAQHQAMLAAVQRPAAGAVSVVAIAAGVGLEQILRDYGATVVRGGQAMNPSTAEILAAIEHGGEAVIVLPNNKNIIWAAEQAAALATKQVRVLPTRSVPEGIAALLACRPDAALDENSTAMLAAGARVRTAALTRASRPATIGGMSMHPGQPLGLIDDELAVTGDTMSEAALAALERLLDDRSSVVTIYSGLETSPTDSASLAGEIQRRWPSLDVQALHGGQPLYDYLISVE
jgi:uncharacterized protein